MKQENGRAGAAAPKKGLLLSLCLVLCSSIFSTIAFYAQNYVDLAFRYAVPFLLLFGGIGFLAYLICRLLLRDHAKAAVLTAWLMTVFCNFGSLFFYLYKKDTNQVPRVLYVECAIPFILLSLLLFWLLRRAKADTVRVIRTALAAAFAFLVLFNAGLSVAGLAGLTKKTMEESTREQLLQAAREANVTDRPNIYLFIFDKYAGPHGLEEDFHFDNSAFYESLEARGFTVSRESTNYGGATQKVMAGLLNLEYPYRVDEKVSFEFGSSQAERGVIFPMMEELGYTAWATTQSGLVINRCPIPGLNAGRLPKAEDGTNFIPLFLDRSAIFFLARDYTFSHVLFGVGEQPHPWHENLMMLLDYYGEGTFPEEATFYFAHIVMPHEPFYYNAAGEWLGEEDPPLGTDEYWARYLEYLQWANPQIERIADNLISQDPDSIVILMSDHGTSPNNDAYNGANILSAVYYRGQPLEEVRDESGANILRIILNKTFGMDLPMVPAPKGWDEVLAASFP